MNVAAIQPQINKSAFQRNVSFSATITPEQLKKCKKMIAETAFNKKLRDASSANDLFSRLATEDHTILETQKDLISRLGTKLKIKPDKLNEAMNNLRFSSNLSNNIIRETVDLGNKFLDFVSKMG